MTLFNSPSLKSLPTTEECELTHQHNLEIQQLLPLLGPIFGLAIIMFHVWDYLIDPSQAWLALTVRLGLVCLGAIAYFPTPLSWSAIERCGFIYWTHVSAIIISEYILPDGFLYGLSGITACVFTVSVITYRIKTFLIILSAPTILFTVLIFQSHNKLLIMNGLMMYIFSVVFAIFVLIVIRSFRQTNFLNEKKLTHLTRKDSLTGVNNRSYIIELGEHAFAIAQRHHRPLALAMLDIDFFKKVNDQYGHDIGDQVIRELATTCILELRQIDHFGRMGGEEFICILPETSEEEAWQCMERLRIKISELHMETPQGSFGFTISIGIAIRNDQHSNWSALLKDADIAMYKAKNNGRNQTVLFSTSHPQSTN